MRARICRLRAVAIIVAVTAFVSMSRGQAPAGGRIAWMQLAATPPMGWNSWNNFGCNVSEALVHEMADAMIAARF